MIKIKAQNITKLIIIVFITVVKLETNAQEVNSKCCCTDMWLYCLHFSPSIEKMVIEEHDSFLSKENYIELLKLNDIMFEYIVNTTNDSILDVKFLNIQSEEIKVKMRRYFLKEVSVSIKIFKDGFVLPEIYDAFIHTQLR